MGTVLFDTMFDNNSLSVINAGRVVNRHSSDRKNSSPVLFDRFGFLIGNNPSPAIIVSTTITAGDYYVKTSKNSI